MTKSTIRERVEQLLRECGISKPPVPIDKIAKHLVIVVRFAPTRLEVAGALIINGDEAYIAVNDAHSENRQRFTIAHEIGHFCLHKQGDHVHFDQDFLPYSQTSRSVLAINNREVDANQFAAELLMPTSMLEADFVRLRGSEEGSLAVSASRYKVSGAAMESRLQTLGLILPGID